MLASLKKSLEQDLHGHGIRSWRLDMIFRRPELYYQRHLRLVEFLQGRNGLMARVLRIPVRFRLQRLSVRTGISVPPGVFGPGLSIAHYGSIVVNSKAKVGRYCRIHSATNIGVAKGKTPIIGDYVYIGPGAVIYGGIKIGDYAVIGANSVVNSDVAPNTTVAGTPARKISDRGSRDIMPAWYESMGLYDDRGDV